LAVADVERSLAFYLAVLGPLGMHEMERFPTYRGTEEVVYVRYGDQFLRLRPADGREHHYHDLASSTWRSTSILGRKWMPPTAAAWTSAQGFTSRPRRIGTSRATTS
jgi:catechol 2,3-dioxygenase-like lactoylglutathione lyase family enzyme